MLTAVQEDPYATSKMQVDLVYPCKNKRLTVMQMLRDPGVGDLSVLSRAPGRFPTISHVQAHISVGI